MIMVSLKEFSRASFEKKCELICTTTNYLATRDDGDLKLYLYHANLFFIEVQYSPLHKKVMQIQGFDDSDYLLPYVEAISLEELNV
jgi:hypothetical protein